MVFSAFPYSPSHRARVAIFSFNYTDIRFVLLLLIKYMYVMESDRLRVGDKVLVKVYEDTGELAARSEGTGFHTVREAIDATYESMADGDDKADKRDYVFEVSDLTTGTSARYRVNAHGNVRLIV